MRVNEDCQGTVRSYVGVGAYKFRYEVDGDKTVIGGNPTQAGGKSN